MRSVARNIGNLYLVMLMHMGRVALPNLRRGATLQRCQFLGSYAVFFFVSLYHRRRSQYANNGHWRSSFETGTPTISSGLSVWVRNCGSRLRFFGRGSAPDPAGGACDAPRDPLVGWGGDTLYPYPVDASVSRSWRITFKLLPPLHPLICTMFRNTFNTI